MDERTSKFYADHAEDLAASYESSAPTVLAHLRLAFRPGQRVLDVGAGTGRDLHLLAAEGVDAYGVEPAEAMRRVALARHPTLAGRIREGSLPALRRDDLCPDGYDGVLCSAVLHHVERARLFDAALALRALLKRGGRLLVSLPSAPDGADGPSRYADGRWHNGVGPDELDLLFVRIGFHRIERWDEDDALGRPERRWTTLLYRLDADGDASSVSRPLDLVQAVLARDRKTATYKPALLRALTDLALTQPNRVRWSGGHVLVPLEAVAERWIHYYWPIFESRVFLPQINVGARAEVHRLGFAAELASLIASHRRAGGLPAFSLALREEKVKADGRFRRLMGRLKATIVRGPVRHAGGSLELAAAVFRAQGDDIVVDAALWKELAVSGYWIRDALLLRWAELVVRFSDRRVGIDQAVAALCVEPTPERDQQLGRTAFGAMPDLRCVWTDKALGGGRFDVDHVIPFSLWRSNDLWNLVPSSPSVNRAKSDALPARGLLLRRREALLRCWEGLREAAEVRFDREARILVGRDLNDLDDLFGAVAESIEVTATQTGTPRWAPKERAEAQGR